MLTSFPLSQPHFRFLPSSGSGELLDGRGEAMGKSTSEGSEGGLSGSSTTHSAGSESTGVGTMSARQIKHALRSATHF